MSSEEPCELRSLDVALNIVGVEKVRSENLRLRSKLDGGHSIRVLNEKSVSDGENLCPLWLEILESLRYGVGDIL